MKTNDSQLWKKVLQGGFVLVLALTGCSKESLEGPALDTGDPAGTTKTAKYVVLRDDVGGGTYAVFKANGSCVEPYGSITNVTSYSHPSLVTANQVGLSHSNCTIDPSNCQLDRGATAGTWSNQWYIIYPQFGPSPGTRKYVRFRLKNITMTPSNGEIYNQLLKYNGTSNTWNVAAAVSSGLYEVQVLSGLLTLCGEKG